MSHNYEKNEFSSLFIHQLSDMPLSNFFLWVLIRLHNLILANPLDIEILSPGYPCMVHSESTSRSGPSFS